MAQRNRIVRLFGPILPWEMTGIARRSRYFTARVVLAGILLFVLWSVYAATFSVGRVSTTREFQQFAESFFTTYSATVLTMTLLLTPAYTAAAVAVEKQRRTIEYLFVTDLTNSEIVLGKWAARTLNVVMLLLTGIPIIALAMLFGGIDWTHLLLFAVECIVVAMSTASLAILISVHTNQLRDAMSRAYAVLILLLLSPQLTRLAGGLTEALLKETSAPGWVQAEGPRALYATADFLGMCEPFTVFFSTLQSQGLGPAAAVMPAVHLTFTVGCLSFGVGRVRRVHFEKTGSPKRRWRLRRERKPRGVVGPPMIWKEWRFDASRRRLSLWILYGVLLCFLYVPVGMGFFFPDDFDARSLNLTLRLVGTTLLGFALLLVASRAALAKGSEVDKDAWISLIASPLTGGEIVTGKLAGSMKPLVWAVMTLLPAWFASICLGALSIIAPPLIVVESTVYALFFAAVGLLCSFRQRSGGSALGFTLAVFAFFAGIGQVLSILFLALAGANDQVLFKLIGSSLLWYLLAGSTFRPSELGSIDEEAVSTGVICMLFYAAAASGILVQLISSFPRLSGRSDRSTAKVSTHD